MKRQKNSRFKSSQARSKLPDWLLDETPAALRLWTRQELDDLTVEVGKGIRNA